MAIRNRFDCLCHHILFCRGRCSVSVLMLQLSLVCFGNLAAVLKSREATFTFTNYSELLPWQPQRLNVDWISLSDWSTCGLHTLAFRNSKGFLYNNITNLCTPVSGLALNGTDGSAEVEAKEGQLYWDTAHSCPDGFDLYRTDEAVVCLYVSHDKIDYHTATSSCNANNGSLASVKTHSKLELVAYLSQGENKWIGVDDIENEGQFIWQLDGTALTTDEISIVFAEGEPNGGDDLMDCIHFWSDGVGLDDYVCSYKYSGFICETYVLK